MSFKTFLWIEDRKEKSSYWFWKCFCKQLCHGIEVVSKNNNSELIKAVKNLKDTNNRYVIVFDNSFDNLQVAMEWKLLKQCADKKENVTLMDIICFEYILLEFKNLVSWIYAPEDDFFVKRSRAIAARTKLIESVQAGNI